MRYIKRKEGIMANQENLLLAIAAVGILLLISGIVLIVAGGSLNSVLGISLITFGVIFIAIAVIFCLQSRKIVKLRKSFAKEKVAYEVVTPAIETKPVPPAQLPPPPTQPLPICPSCRAKLLRQGTFCSWCGKRFDRKMFAYTALKDRI